VAHLDDFLSARRDRPFEYFAHDCVHLAADWVLEKTGSDPLAPLRADLLDAKNLLAALRYVRAAGGFVAAAERLLGPSLPGLMAQRGDVVLMRSGGRVGRVSGFSFGLATGTHLAGPGPNELVFVPVTEGVAAWRV